MRVLTEDEHVLEDEGDNGCQHRQPRERRRPEPDTERDVERQDSHEAADQGKGSSRLTCVTRQQNRIPEIADPVGG